MDTALEDVANWLVQELIIIYCRKGEVLVLIREVVTWGGS